VSPMTNFFSDIVAYHPHSPDQSVPVCQNTGEAGDGVVFLGFEPMVGAFSFVGRNSIVEAVAVLYGLTPAEVTKRLTSAAPKPARVAKKDEGTAELV